MPTIKEPELLGLKIEEMNKNISKINKTLYGTKGKNPSLIDSIVTKIFDKMDYDKMYGSIISIKIGVYILITLVVVGLALQWIFQSQLADISDITNSLP